MDRSSEITEFARILLASEKAVVLTGAGISTESGLPDYRGPSGLWRNKSFEEIANIKTYERDPRSLWEFYEQRLETFREATPNSGHRAVAALQEAGIVKGVITQNIDGLHKAAGSEAAEVHGSIREAMCPGCNYRTAMPAVVSSLPECDYLPLCPECGTVLKPAVILFGEMLPAAVDDAYTLLIGCDLLIVLGSSLLVHPVAGFPAHVIKQNGKLVIVTHSQTPWDPDADLRFFDGVGETMQALVETIGL